ncbi:protease-4 [Anseongella ginsenosidimutans]|uniref:Protease-4 n=1 Tax=Anseongella ginsenosidimutans TaxID=496056 RepID=A0A4R3KPD5_9SPHI|nr:signal peptide peptidase SppA [Anseongella ginsenosidimutans]QEC53707.1 signal peptide peptidase SppA [Anseongella ginsenosidimutans]TCS86042.1 protease-4 [Anseongella ginsenosidimutans]
MKQFFKFMFASMLGVFFSFLLLLVFFFIFLAALFSAGAADETITLSGNTLLVASFNQNIPERTPQSPFPGLDLPGVRNVTGLNDILANIRKAESDKNIKGIYLDLSYVPEGLATIEEIRNALQKFRESGKFILAYGEVYSQTAYYLASVANKIYLHPEGALDFSGLSTDVVFFKGLLEKLEIEPQVIRVGAYKSAVEPFTEEQMSEASREQMNSYLQDLYQHFLASVATSRGISRDSLHLIADSLLVRQPSDALAYRMIDGLKYKDQVIAELKKMTGTPKENDMETVTMGAYTRAAGESSSKQGIPERIAVIYATGEIVSGEGSDFLIGSERLSRAIREARRDDEIEAIVLRVNSPGGSALASDVIWREMSLAKEEKPVVVSMGNTAASGGYYISCAAHKIVAQPNTLTGSIGVFAVIPNMQGFFNHKLGLTFDGVKTGAYSDLGTITRPLTPGEKAIVQEYINDVYADFTGHVAKGRGMTLPEVDSVARGRVWSGIGAVEAGLVDTLGGIRDALEIAAGMAGTENYRVIEYPSQKGPLEELLNNMGGNIRTWMVKQELGENYRYFETLKQLPRLSGVQALLPFEIEIR